MTKLQLTGTEQVKQYMELLNHPLKEVVERVRQFVIDIDPEIGEQIKWNSPAFYYTGKMAPFNPKEYKRDIVVLHLRKKDHVLLIFPTGAKITDTTGTLEGNYTDGRKMVTLHNIDDLENKKEGLKFVIKQWLQQIDR